MSDHEATDSEDMMTKLYFKVSLSYSVKWCESISHHRSLICGTELLLPTRLQVFTLTRVASAPRSSSIEASSVPTETFIAGDAEISMRREDAT